MKKFQFLLLTYVAHMTNDNVIVTSNSIVGRIDHPQKNVLLDKEILAEKEKNVKRMKY